MSYVIRALTSHPKTYGWLGPDKCIYSIAHYAKQFATLEETNKFLWSLDNWEATRDGDPLYRVEEVAFPKLN